jgi:hypothetical protein
MKYFFLVLSVILVTSCNKEARIGFEGTTPGIKSGTFIIKTLSDSTLIGADIKDGKFQANGVLPKVGYYTMDIVDNANKSSHDKHFEVYLESGQYGIQTSADNFFNYPKITSSSVTQNELSGYNDIVDKLSGVPVQKIEKAKDGFTNLPGFVALEQFIKQNPKNTISAHLMSKMDYESSPKEYFELYQTFSAASKNSTEGKEIGDKLSHLIKLIPGSQSPVIAGITPDGKPFDPSSIKKKLILIDFWRASNQVSRLNHKEMQNIVSEFKGKDVFEIVSVSIDSKKDWWTGAIQEDQLSWPHVSDLKGDDSKNAANWAIGQIPTYYLVDGDWKIVARDVQLQEVRVYINEYLNKH